MAGCWSRPEPTIVRTERSREKNMSKEQRQYRKNEGSKVYRKKRKKVLIQTQKAITGRIRHNTKESQSGLKKT